MTGQYRTLHTLCPKLKDLRDRFLNINMAVCPVGWVMGKLQNAYFATYSVAIKLP